MKKARDRSAERLVPVASLRPYERNARAHSPVQVEQICASIRAFGWTVPLIVDEALRVLAGHGRLAAAKRLGLDRVPCVVLAGLTDAQKRAYTLADNKLALNASWDRDILAGELKELRGTAELDVAGFSFLELSQALDSPKDIEAAPDEPEKPKSKLGDMYQLGAHRVLCGDARDPAHVKRVAPGGWDCAVIDPPFEVDDLDHLTDPSVVFSGTLALARKVPENLFRFERVLHKGIGHNMPSTCVRMLHAYVIQVGSEKTCPTYTKGQKRKVYPSVVKWGGDGWAMDRAGDDERSGPQDSMRRHQKPVWLVVEHLTAWMKPWRTVFDPFAGSGTTVMAAEQLGRACAAIELSPARVDVIVARWERFTGDSAKRLKP